MQISFDKLYKNEQAKEIIEKTNITAKISRLSDDDTSVILGLLSATEKNQITKFCILTPVGETTKNSAQQAFVDLVNGLSKEDDCFESLRSKGWFFSPDSVQNITSITKRYGAINGYFVFKDAEVPLLMIRAIRAVVDAKGIEALAEYSFRYEIKSISTHTIAPQSDVWFPLLSEYDPGITKDKWLSLLNDPDVIGPVWGGFLAAFYKKKEGASCKEIGEMYGKSPSAIIGNCTNLGKKIYQKTGCPLGVRDNGQNRYWTIMFFGRDANDDESGSYIWKLRPELYEALTEFDIMRFEWKRGETEVPVIIDVGSAINNIKTYIANKGFDYPDGMIENFYLSLKSKPFVILAGTSGTGKTRLVKLFAEAIGAAYKLVPVRPDWSDSTDLFGHVDLNGHFVPGAVIDFIRAALDDPNKPYFLCLDEMNLARVEYYLSDFLSVIETRDMVNGEIISDPLISETQYGSDKNAVTTYGRITFPQNLYVVGTVNMDETTFPFSKKVLDRANTIEFSYVDLMPKALTGDGIEAQSVPNSFLRSDYLLLSQCADEAEYVGEVCSELQKINMILQKANAHVGYRVRDEIVFYMLNNKKADNLLSHNEALDHEILQKTLPRIQGSSATVKDMLCKLFDSFAADHNQRSGDSDSEKMQKVLDDENTICKYRKSAEKLLMMVRRFEEDGFTSYWL